jgi:hypothetical protein
MTTPQQELEEFLASKPAWMQRVLQEDISLFSPDELSEWNSNQDTVFELRPEYERILRQIPSDWKEYRKRQKQNCKPLLRMLVSKEVSGRPRKTFLAEEAASLKRAGKNNPQIASELNKRHGSGTTTHDAVRKLLKRHPDKS